MVTPRWVSTRTQPIAAPDIVRYLVGVLDLPEALGKVFEVGGPEVLRYVDMMRRAAVIQNHRTPPIVPIPLLTPRLSSMWLALVTDVDQATARNLVDSMNNEVIVQDDTITRLLPGELMGYDDAVRLALDERAAEERENQKEDRPNEEAGNSGQVADSSGEPIASGRTGEQSIHPDQDSAAR
jgi:hypothetical protein